MMPRLAALSMAEMNSPTSFASGVVAEPERFFIPRRRDRTLRLRRERPAIWRARLAADFVLAIVFALDGGRGGSRRRRRLSTKARGRPNGFRIRPISYASTPDFRASRWRRSLKSVVTGVLSVGLTLVVINSLGEPGLAFGTFGQRIGNDLHYGTQLDLIVKGSDIARLHPDAP